MIKVDGLHELAVRLARHDLTVIEKAALEDAATVLRDAVRQRLSRRPGGPHDAPWIRSGALRDSVSCEVSDTEAVIGSADPVAVDQECGTRTDPPRPFLAPVAAAEAGALVTDIAATIHDRLRALLS